MTWIEGARTRALAELVVVMVTVVVIVAVIVVMTVPVLGVVRTVTRLIFRGLHEVYRSIAGVVLMAVLVPVLGVSGRHVQVDRLDRGGAGDHWNRVRGHRL